MSSYNLKAKNKKTWEIVEFTYTAETNYAMSKKIGDDTYGFGIYSTEQFNTLYEVIEDTPTIKENLKTDTQEGWREELPLFFEDFYKRMSIWIPLKDRKYIIEWWLAQCGFIEQQAYKQGKADAYRESASVARGYINDELILNESKKEQLVRDTVYTTSKSIAQAIEQLTSNKYMKEEQAPCKHSNEYVCCNCSNPITLVDIEVEAYKKCAKMFRDMKLVCTHGCTKDNQDECEFYSYENMRMNETYEKYAELIEKLASKVVEINHVKEYDNI